MSGVGIHGKAVVRAVQSREGDRVTTLELFFDLAFVFAFTQLSRLMAQQHDALGVAQALVVLVLLWWSWTAYGWLSNNAHADQGVVRIAMIIGMTAMFVAGLVVLEAFDDLPGGLFAPTVFVAAYLLARVTHAVVFVWLSDPALRRRTLSSVTLSVVPAAMLLIAGAVLGEPWQLWCSLAAIAVEPVVSYRTSIGVDWPVRSVAHFSERHGLIVILALGESILGIGAGASSEPVSGAILVGVIVSMLICVELWWAYFTRLATASEDALKASPVRTRARAATDAYTYLHLPVVAGIVLAALGLEVAMAHIDTTEPYGFFGAAALGGGVACYLAGTTFFARRLLGEWIVTRLVFATALGLCVPLIALVTPIVALAGVASLLLVLFAVEGMRLRASGRTVRRLAGDRRTARTPRA